MKIIDLSHFMDEEMPVYPGTEQPVFDQGCSLDADGFREKKITLYSHTGTHMDAPSHLLEKGLCLDDYAVDKFQGDAFVLDATEAADGIIGEKDIAAVESELLAADYLLIRTGWSRYWGQPDYFGRFPVLSEDAARDIAVLGLKGIGFDCISADPMDAADLPNHRILLGAGLVIIENLTNLDSLPSSGFVFSALPLKIREADGSPVRAAAMLF